MRSWPDVSTGRRTRPSFWTSLQDAVDEIEGGEVALPLAGIEGALGAYELAIGTVNALNYCDPDGTTDNTTGLQAAIAVAAGRRLYFPKATYVLRATDAYGNGLWIDAPNTVLEFAPGAIIKGHAASAVGLSLVNIAATNIQIIGGIFDGNGIDDCYGIRIRNGSSRVLIARNTFQGVEFPIYGSGSTSRVTIRDNNLLLRRWGILTQDASTPKRWIIADNHIDGSTMVGGGDAIEINTPDGWAEDFIISGNTIDSILQDPPASFSGIGIGVAHGRRGTISNNIVRNCGLDGIHVEDDSSEIVISGNVVTDCDRAGIAVNGSNGTAPLRGVIVQGNTVRECGKTQGAGAIALEGSIAVEECVVDGNTVVGCGPGVAAKFFGIDLNHAAIGHRVTNNIVRGTLGTTAYGLRLDDCTDVQVSGNRLTDQDYAIFVTGDITRTQIAHNHLHGNATGTIDESAIGSTSAYTKVDNIT